MSHPLLDQYDDLVKAIRGAAVLGENADHLIARHDRLRLGIVAALKIADVLERANG